MDGFTKLLTYVEAVKVKHNLKHEVFGVEPTANYHKPLGEYLIRCGLDVVLVAGTAVKKNRELLDGRWDKNDTKDSANVADLISQGKFLYYDYPCMPLRNLRNLLSLKRRLKKHEHRIRVRIRNNLLAEYFPEIDRYFGRISNWNLAIVKWCLSPAVIAGLAYEEFVQMVAPGKRAFGQEKKLHHIWKTAEKSVGCDAGEALQFEARMIVDELQKIREAISEVDRKIEDVCLDFPEYRFLLTIPGFGKDIASKVLGSIGNPFRFSSRRQVLKLAGWDLSAKGIPTSSLTLLKNSVEGPERKASGRR
jgi:transposase